MNTKIDRRNFLRIVSGFGMTLTASTLTSRLVFSGLGLALGESAEAAINTYSSGSKALFFDNGDLDWLASSEGGSAVAEVIEEETAPTVKKHIANPKYQDMAIRVGSNMSTSLKDLIRFMLENRPKEFSGSILTTNNRLQAISALVFKNARISEVGFPAVDARSNTAAYLSLKLTPEYTTVGKKSSNTQVSPISNIGNKKWLTANFRLSFDKDSALTSACSRILGMDAITVKQSFDTSVVGEFRDVIYKPQKLDISNLVITLPEAFAEAFYAWHQRFVVEGANSDQDEKSVTLEYLAPDLKQNLYTLKFLNVGIISAIPLPLSSGEQIPLVRVEMYCEQISFA